MKKKKGHGEKEHAHAMFQTDNVANVGSVVVVFKLLKLQLVIHFELFG